MFSSATEKDIQIRILVDAIILIITAVVVSLFYIDIITPFRRGFFCDDESIKYPHQDDTVTDSMLYAVSFTLGFIVIVLSEFFPIGEETSVTEKKVHLFKLSIPRRFVHIYTSTYVFIFGVCITDILTNFIKYPLGRLRPHFLDVCQPDFNCSSGDPHRYVEDYICLSPDIDKVNNARLSFPSGHTSVVVYSMLFSMIYLHKRFECLYGKLLKPVLQIFMFLWASFTAVSRIGDNKHHSTDVMGGAVLGIATCYAMICIRPDYSPSSPSRDPEKSENGMRLNTRTNLDTSSNNPCKSN